jgi:N-hydroxyarylamine O-acetyltransferase
VTADLDLDAYLARIAYRGPLERDHATLAAVLAAHMAAIPFENLDVLLGRPVRLDLEGLQAKLVSARRGGYCFEHATLLGAVLDRLGFAPVTHTARVTVIVPRAEAPRTHMFLTVTLPEGRFVIDPGFGALAPRVPVPLPLPGADEGAIASIGDEQHRVVREREREGEGGRDTGGCGAWLLRAKRGDTWVDAWVTTMERDYPVDFELGNFYTWRHPSSPFVNRLMLRALLPDGRVSAMNRDVTFVRGGRTETRRLASRAELRALLAEHFGVDLPPGEVEGLRIPSDPEWA